MKPTTPRIEKRLEHLSDDEVLANLGSVIGSRRKITAQLVAYLGEVEARRLERREACSSMYEFCCRKLKLSEGSAHRHLAAARIAQSYPVVLDLLREGRIHVTALSMLQRYLDTENHAELLAAACDKSKAEVELLIRSRFPKKDVADSMRPLPVQARLEGDAAAAGQSVGAAAQSGAAESGRAAHAAGGESAAGVPRTTTVELYKPRSHVSPLSAERFHIQFSAGTALKDKLERALDLMSHSNPKRDLATVIERGLDLVLADLEKKTLGKTKHPRRSRGTKHGDFSRQARREIYERDGEQCTYVSPSGERCQARAFIQLDHENPRTLGGPGTTRNGRLLCRAHNLFEAEKVFGRQYIESRIRLRQQRLGSESRRPHEQSSVVQASSGAGPQPSKESSVQVAVELHSMGGATRLRQQRLGSESRRPHEQATGAADVEGAIERKSVGCAIRPRQRTLGKESRRGHAQASIGVDAEPPASIDPPGGRTSSADETSITDARSCSVHDACELHANESLRYLEHAAGGAAGLRSELLPSGAAASQACADSAEMESKLVSALTNMGFRRGESKKAAAALAWRGDNHNQRAVDLAALVRRALAILVP